MVKTFYPIQTSFSILDYFCQSTTFDDNSEKNRICNKVIPVGYVKSPYENRAAVIVIYSVYVFEDSEMFTLIYGCSLDYGF